MSDCCAILQRYESARTRMFRSGVTWLGEAGMLVYRHWSRAEEVAVESDGTERRVACWGGSEVSIEDAQVRALEKARRVAARIRSGQEFPGSYEYSSRQLREEILQEFRDNSGELTAVVTRNAYGAEVLNAARVLFVDVDLDQGSGSSLLGRLLAWIRSAPPPKTVDQKLSRLVDWIDKHPDWGARIYRTKAGLRYLVTHAEFTPGSPEVEAMMVHVGCDPRYIQMCRAQRSFRARLTPKPWRCGVPLPPNCRPPLDADRRALVDSWLGRYAAVCARFATCSFGGQFGNPEVLPGTQPIILFHDDSTRALSSLPLA